MVPSIRFVPLFINMAAPITVRNNTGSKYEVVVSSRMMNIIATAIASIIFISFSTFSSVNLLVGDMPTIYPLSPIISSISSIA